MATSLPDDLLIGAEDEVAIRQDLVLTALGKRPADTLLRVGRLLDVHTRSWRDDQEIAIKGRRIAWTGPAGTYPGTAARRVEKPDLAAVPGFGEVHKHIESTHLTPEWEAALVLPRGNTWTCEASHEFSNVDGPNNLAFWFEARRRGSPLKIFPLPGSAVPPTAYEWGGGWYGYDEQKGFLKQSLMVAGLDEVMDWPAVWNPENPSYPRLWGMIRATFEQRGVVEGHGAGPARHRRDQRLRRRRPGLRPRGVDAGGGVGEAGPRHLRRAAALFDAGGDPLADRTGPGRLVADRLHHRRPQRLRHASSSAPPTTMPGWRSGTGWRRRSRSSASPSTRPGTCG